MFHPDWQALTEGLINLSATSDNVVVAHPSCFVRRWCPTVITPLVVKGGDDDGRDAQMFMNEIKALHYKLRENFFPTTRRAQPQNASADGVIKLVIRTRPFNYTISGHASAFSQTTAPSYSHSHLNIYFIIHPHIICGPRCFSFVVTWREYFSGRHLMC